MRHGSLFNGIGGFQLAAHWMGWENVFHCEINKFCNEVVKKHFPESICYEDIKQTDFTPWRGAIDILTGGFPCQPYSVIGGQQGTADERHLWPEYRRAVRECLPVWVVGENVAGLLTWNGGGVFETICTDLEAEGYAVGTYSLPACGVGAAHRRDRVWIVAYSAERRLERRNSLDPKGYGKAQDGPIPALVEDRDWYSFARSFIHGSVHGVPYRVERNMALGNAIVPQVAYQIFKAIQKMDNTININSYRYNF